MTLSLLARLLFLASFLNGITACKAIRSHTNKSTANSTSKKKNNDSKLGSIMSGHIQEIIIDKESSGEIIFVFQNHKTNKTYEIDPKSPVHNSLHEYTIYDKIEVTIDSKPDANDTNSVLNLPTIKVLKILESDETSNMGQLSLFASKPSFPIEFKVAFVVLHFKEDRAVTVPNADFVATVKKNIEASSWGNIVINSTIDDVYTFQVNREFKKCGINHSGTALTYLKNHFSERGEEHSYNRIITFIPSKGACDWAGSAYLSSLEKQKPGAIVTRSSSTTVATHELGHSFGLRHSGKDSDNDGKYTSSDWGARYHDRSCIMGSGSQVVGLNASKLFDLGVLRPDYGLKPVTSGELTLSGLSQEPNQESSAVAYVYDNYIFSYRTPDVFPSLLSSEYVQGVSIHVRTAATRSNAPSSILTAIVKPGDVWEDPKKDSDFRMQVLDLDMFNKTARLGFNGDIVPLDEIFKDNCFISGMDRISLTPTRIPAPLGHLNFLFRPDGIGECGKKEFRIELEGPKENAIDILSSFKMDYDFSSSSYKQVRIPYRIFTENPSYPIKVKVFTKNTLLYEYTHKLYLDTCTPGDESCEVDECENRPAISYMFDISQIKSGNTVQGDLIVADINPQKCGMQKYKIAIPFSGNTPYKPEEITLGAKLSDSSYTGSTGRHTKQKDLYLLAGEAVHIPIQIKYTSSNVTKGIAFRAVNVTNEENHVSTFSSLGQNSSWRNIYDKNTHPFRPVSLKSHNITGKIPVKPACEGGEIDLPSPDGTNSCHFKWKEAHENMPVVIENATAGGYVSGTCLSDGKIIYTVFCPNKPGGPAACVGGSAIIESSDKSNRCHFTWPITNANQSINITSPEDGKVTGTCQQNGQWTYEAHCPDK